MRKTVDNLPPVIIGLIVVLIVTAAIYCAGWFISIVDRYFGFFPYHSLHEAEFFGYGVIVWLAVGLLAGCYRVLTLVGIAVQNMVKL